MINWPEIIEALRRHGMSHGQIARQVGVSESAIGMLSRGAIREPRYSVGIRMLQIHSKVSRETQEIAVGITVHRI